MTEYGRSPRGRSPCPRHSSWHRVLVSNDNPTDIDTALRARRSNRVKACVETLDHIIRLTKSSPSNTKPVGSEYCLQGLTFRTEQNCSCSRTPRSASFSFLLLLSQVQGRASFPAKALKLEGHIDINHMSSGWLCPHNRITLSRLGKAPRDLRKRRSSECYLINSYTTSALCSIFIVGILSVRPRQRVAAGRETT